MRVPEVPRADNIKHFLDDLSSLIPNPYSRSKVPINL
jgi:hypothetical protein